MTRSVRLYTATQFEEVKTLVDLMTERSDLPPAERGKLILEAVGQVNARSARA